MLERFFIYSKQFTVGAGLTIQDQRISIRQDADFYLRAMSVLALSDGIGGRFRRADGSWFSGNQFMHLSGFCQTAGVARHTPIYPEIRYPASGAFVFDLSDIGGAGDTAVWPFLVGVERYADGALPGPASPPRYREEPYTVTVPITIVVSAAGTQVLQIPVQCNTGDAFEIRTLSWRPTSVAVPTLMNMRLKDEYGRYFMTLFVPMRKLFAGPDEANEPYPGVTFPGMVIPANGMYFLDFSSSEAGTYSFELAFGGVRQVAV